MFRSGDLLENDDEIADETSFVFNVDNARILAFAGDQPKWAEVASGGEGMKMVVGIIEGGDKHVMPAFMVFKNDKKNHPIRDVPDNIEEVL